METFSTLQAFCVGNSPVTGEFPSQRPVTRSFGVFFDLCLNKRLSKQSWAGDLRRHRAHYDVIVMDVRCVLKRLKSHPTWLLQQLVQVSNKGIITPTKYWPIVREFTRGFSSQRAYIKEKFFLSIHPWKKFLQNIRDLFFTTLKF